ncbi:MAG: hypothetical protein ABIN80_12735 [Dyadobacter sp.]|uniref:DUF6934 family protein n=1 Tax=Dyadobacter sp. TaxID=1914288 RepID=UPI00326718E5
MNIEKYEVKRLDAVSYQFFSEGPRGKIVLRIIFTFDKNQFCNLCFGVWNQELGEIDDLVEIRNGDMDRLLTTVGQLTIDFLMSNPRLYVFATGSSAARTRKYQMGINQNLEYIRERHQVLGFVANKVIRTGDDVETTGSEGEWYVFQKGINYDGFLIYLK